MTRPGTEASERDPGHAPVLIDAVIDLLAVQQGGRYIDATFGGGGHCRAILERSSPDGRVLALDADPAAIHRAHDLQASYPGRLLVERSNFRCLGDVARKYEFQQVDGVLFDLGLSSFQFDQRERGFSLHSEARLDMRLDPDADGPTAWELVNEWPADDLADLIFRFGEERRSRRIGRVIAERRAESPIETNAELAQIVQYAVGGRRGSRIHPATKTFQAIRIAVNQELDALQDALIDARDSLAPGGRIAVISFHSLEDRITKQYFQTESRDCVCPPDLPVCCCDHKSTLQVITRRPVVPDEAEMQQNPRSRSARLRVAERI